MKIVIASHYMIRFFSRLAEWLVSSKWKRRTTFLVTFLIFLFGTRYFLSHIHEEKQEYIIAYDPNWGGIPLNGQTQEFVGFSDALLAAISKMEKKSFRPVRVGSVELFDLLQSEKVDGVLTARSPDIVIQDRFLFSDPYYPLGLVLVVDKDDTMSSLEDLENKEIGILSGSPALFYLPHKLEKQIRIIPFETSSKMLEALIQKNLDGALIGFMPAQSMVQGYYKGKIRIATPTLTQEGFRLVAKRNASGQTLIDLFNRSLAVIEKEETYKSLLLKWGLFEPITSVTSP